MYFALINTFERDAQHAGRIISRHRSLEVAARCQEKFDRAVKRANGVHSYVPTRVVVVSPALRVGSWVRHSDIEDERERERI